MTRRERGVAVVVAILIVALATSTASYIVWHQSLWLRQVENLTARAQADALARAAATWAAVILAADDASVDHLGEAWARKLPPFPADRAELTGVIVDEQGKLNVNNLVREGDANAHDVVAFQRLLAALGLPPALAEAVVDWIDPDSEVMPPNGAEDPYYLRLNPPYRAANRPVLELGELARVKGFNAAIVAKLAPFVTALPVPTAVNVNTAPAQVLQAIIPSLAAADAARIVDERSRKPFASREEFLRALPKGTSSASIDAQIDVRSKFFSAEATVRLGRVVTGYRALFQREERRLPALLAMVQIAI